MKNKLRNIIVFALLVSLVIVPTAFAADALALGDLNADEVITAADARIALRVAAKLEQLTAEQTEAADVNYSGEVTAEDARLILRVAAKLDVFPEKPSEEPSETKPTEPSTEPSTKPTEPTTEPTTEPSTKPTEPVVKYPAAIDAFFSGKYYLEGEFGNADDMFVSKMAVNGKDFEVNIPFEGNQQLSLLSLGNKRYLKAVDSDGNKYVVEITSGLMSVLGLDINFDILFSEANFGGSGAPGTPEVTKKEADGKTYDVYTFTKNATKINFYTDGDTIVKIETVSAGKTNAVGVSTLSSEIPDDMLTVKGYTETNIFALAAMFQ